MINPSVFELAKVEINNQTVCIEDNIGEGMHLHIGLVRFDMTVPEFLRMTETLRRVLDAVTPDFFYVDEYDAYFLERIASAIPNIIAIEPIRLKLSDLEFCFELEPDEIFSCNVQEIPVFRYYNGEEINLERFENKGDIFESNRERADFVLDAIKKNTAPINVIVDERNRLLDGCLTAAASAHLNGVTFEIAARKVYFDKPFDELAVRRLRRQLW